MEVKFKFLVLLAIYGVGAGTFFTIFLDIDPGNVTIISTAIIASMLSYLGTMMSAENRKKEHREIFIKELVDQGWEFHERARECCMSQICYMPIKKERFERYNHIIGIMKEQNQQVEAAAEKVDKDNSLTNRQEYRERQRQRKSLQEELYRESEDIREYLNSKSMAFISEETKCVDSAVRLQDSCSVFKKSYRNNKQDCEKLVEHALKLVEGLKGIGRVVRDKECLELRKEDLSKVDEYPNLMREELVKIQEKELRGENAKNTSFEERKELIFLVIFFVAFSCLGYLVSSSFSS